MFMIMFAQCLNECNKKDGRNDFTATHHVKDIVDFVNPFLLDYLPKYVKQYNLEHKEFFSVKHIMRVIEYLFNWLHIKKYTGHKLTRNAEFQTEG